MFIISLSILMVSYPDPWILNLFGDPYGLDLDPVDVPP